jgi:coenzyme F420 hydrogenase subunit beta
MIHLHNGEIRFLPLEQLDFMKRYACRYCDDYAAEFADLSFGGIGAPEGWTTVMARSPLGRAVLADARGKNLESINFKDHPRVAELALIKVMACSEKKKHQAQAMHRELEKSVQVKG